MKHKNLCKVLALTMAATMVMSACGNAETKVDEKEESKSVAVESSKEESKEEASSEQEETPIDTSDVEVDVFIVSPWNQLPLPPEGEDMSEEYIESIAGGEWHIYGALEGETELVTRLSSDNVPDIIYFNGATQMQMMYEEGVLIDDWNAYADKLPNFLEAMGENQIRYYTNDEGKLTGLGTKPGGIQWVWHIRQDWLDALNLPMPSNPDELLETLKAFTYDDPDGNGEDDTWGLTIAGGNSIGELNAMLLAFGDFNLHIKEDGTVTHPVLEDYFMDYLKWARAAVEAGVLAPNWFTVGWEERKPDLYNGKYGMVWYPTNALVNEVVHNNGTQNAEDPLADGWGILGECGGKLNATSLLGDGKISVSAQAAADPAKMEVICKFLNTFVPNTPEYLRIVQGVGMTENVKMKEMGDSVYCYSPSADDLSEPDPWYTLCDTYGGIWLWAQLVKGAGHTIATGATEEPNYWTQKMQTLADQADAADHWGNVHNLVNTDPVATGNANTLKAQFETEFILGEKTEADYQAFIEEWLEIGGQQMLDEATAQLKELGYID